jgi:hypothetical protein
MTSRKTFVKMAPTFPLRAPIKSRDIKNEGRDIKEYAQKDDPKRCCERRYGCVLARSSVLMNRSAARAHGACRPTPRESPPGSCVREQAGRDRSADRSSPNRS